MARARATRKCRCRGGTYSAKCCGGNTRGGRGSRAARSPSRTSSSMPRYASSMSTSVVASQTTGRSGPDLGRVAKATADVVSRQKGRIVMSLAVNRRTERMAAYGIVRLDDRVMRHIASIGVRELGGKIAYVGLRVGFKAVPIIGWASLAYDVYQLATVLEEEFEISEKVRA